jgi:hypothetical protein
MLGRWPYERSAVSSRLTFVWPSTRQQRRDFLGKAGRGLVWGLVWGLVLGLGLGLVWGLYIGVGKGLEVGLPLGLSLGLIGGLVGGPVGGLGLGLVETRSVVIASRTPEEASLRSLIAALVWLGLGLLGGLAVGPIAGLVLGWFRGFGQLVFGLGGGLTWLVVGLSVGLLGGLIAGLHNGGRFVVLQKVAKRRLIQAGDLPPRPADFLEWGIERQIFRRVGGGVRFRHSLIQQHISNTSGESSPGRERFEYREEPLVSSSGLARLGGLAAFLSGMLFNIQILYSYFPNAIDTDFALVAWVLMILGLAALYARRPNAMGILGLGAFLIALSGELGLFGTYLYNTYQVPYIAPVNGLSSFFLYCLGWLLLGVSFLRARLYSRLGAMLLITSTLLFGLLNLIALLSGPHFLLSYGSTAFNVLVNIAIAWLGLVLWAGRDKPAESPTRQQPRREQLLEP